MLLDNYSLEIISNNSFKFGEIITSIRLFFALSDSSIGKNYYLAREENQLKKVGGL